MVARMPVRDLTTLLRTPTVSRRPGRFCFVLLGEAEAGTVPQATVVATQLPPPG